MSDTQQPWEAYKVGRVTWTALCLTARLGHSFDDAVLMAAADNVPRSTALRILADACEVQERRVAELDQLARGGEHDTTKGALSAQT